MLNYKERYIGKFLIDNIEVKGSKKSEACHKIANIAKVSALRNSFNEILETYPIKIKKYIYITFLGKQ